jgi:hypothetical protein
MLFHVVNERHRRKRAMIFTTNKSLKSWGGVLHDEDLAQAIIDRVLERGRLFRLDGPSIRTLHVNLDDALNQGSDQDVEVARISGITGPEFPEPTHYSILRTNISPLTLTTTAARSCGDERSKLNDMISCPEPAFPAPTFTGGVLSGRWAVPSCRNSRTCAVVVSRGLSGFPPSGNDVP